MALSATHCVSVRAPLRDPRRLLVTRHDYLTRNYHVLGFLSYDFHVYTFTYLRKAVKEANFRALPGLSDANRVYVAEQLFPVFSERVISARRPDRLVSLEALGLTADAAPFEILQRSGGRRIGDTIEVLPAPTAAPDGSLGIDFLVHGVRYQPAEAHDRVSQLRSGDLLRMIPENDNPQDPHALLVTDSDEVRLGYVPSPLLDLVSSLSGRAIRVVRANGPEVGFHFRLLVQVTGRVAPGTQPFLGPDWETVG